MSDQVAFNEVRFLTPARVDFEANGQREQVVLSVDLVNKKAYLDSELWSWSDELFRHIEAANALPDDFFAAPADVRRQASEAQFKMNSIRAETLQNVRT